MAYAGLLLFLQGVGFLIRKLLIAGGMSEASATWLGFFIVGAIVCGIGSALVVKALGNAQKRTPHPNQNR